MSSETENKKKLERFFDNEYHSLKAYVNSKIRATTEMDSEDLIQDVALKLFAGADRHLPINNVPGFVYHSIKNKIIDVMRKRKQNYSESDENEDKLLEFTELLFGKSDNSYSEEMMDDLKKAILTLKKPYQEIIIAIDFEGYTYKEIAAETGVPEGTLMSQRHRALGKLHKKLKDKKHELIN